MKLIIYGIGPFAKLLYFYLKNDSNYKVVGFCADKKHIQEHFFCGLPIISLENIESSHPPTHYKMIIAVGYSRMRNRKKMFDKVKNKKYEIINYIHSSVVTHNLTIGEGNIILAGCIIEPNVIINNNNVIWSMSLIGHDSTLGSHNYISAKCLISGQTTISNLCFIGNGVTMINGLHIKNETCVGAGAYLRKSTETLGVYVGNPARILKKNPNGIEI